MNGSGKNLGCRCRILAYKDAEAHVLEVSPAIGPENLPGTVKAFHIDYGVSAGKVIVAHEESLVKVSAGIVPYVKDKVFHPLFLEVQGCLMAFLVGCAGEFTQPYVAHGVREHKRGVYAVYGYFSPGNLEGDDLLLPLDGDGDLGSGRSLDTAHHTVLGEFHARDHFVVHLQETVSYHKTHFFRGTSGNDFQHYCGVVGNVELYADSVEISGEFLLGGIEFHGGHIHRVRIQTGKGGSNGGISDTVAGEYIHIGVQFLPVPVFGGNHVLGLPVTDYRQSNEGAKHDAHYYLEYLNCLFTHFLSAQQLFPRVSGGLFRL